MCKNVLKIPCSKNYSNGYTVFNAITVGDALNQQVEDTVSYGMHF